MNSLVGDFDWPEMFSAPSSVSIEHQRQVVDASLMPPYFTLVSKYFFWFCVEIISVAWNFPALNPKLPLRGMSSLFEFENEHANSHQRPDASINIG